MRRRLAMLGFAGHALRGAALGVAAVGPILFRQITAAGKPRDPRWAPVERGSCGVPREGPGLSVDLARIHTLIYELLDAHNDTAEIASRSVLDDAWLGHLEYLRSLQRAGRELLAELSTWDRPSKVDIWGTPSQMSRGAGTG